VSALAWAKVQSNKGAAGVDGQSLNGSRQERTGIWTNSDKICAQDASARKQ